MLTYVHEKCTEATNGTKEWAVCTPFEIYAFNMSVPSCALCHTRTLSTSPEVHDRESEIMISTASYTHLSGGNYVPSRNSEQRVYLSHLLSLPEPLLSSWLSCMRQRPLAACRCELSVVTNAPLDAPGSGAQCQPLSRVADEINRLVL